MKAENSHDLPFTSWRTKTASGIAESKSRGINPYMTQKTQVPGMSMVKGRRRWQPLPPPSCSMQALTGLNAIIHIGENDLLC